MRLEFDEQGYVCCILYGCYTGTCSEYTGLVPTEPEVYEDMDDWADRAQTQAYRLDSNGNLTYDAERAASLPGEDDVEPLPTEYLQKLGIIDAIYPVGSIYMSVNEVSPETLFGGTWEQIEDRFILAAGSTYEGGSDNADGVSQDVTVNIPKHKHLTPIIANDNVFGVWTVGASESKTATNRIGVSGSALTSSYTAKTYYTAEDGACSTKVTVPPTIPPYMAVFVWKRTA